MRSGTYPWHRVRSRYPLQPFRRPAHERGWRGIHQLVIERDLYPRLQPTRLQRDWVWEVQLGSLFIKLLLVLALSSRFQLVVLPSLLF